MKISVRHDVENYEKKLIKIAVGDVVLEGDLTIPDNVHALVIFSHGSGSSRFSPRNNFVAQQLNRRGIATFLVDLLTPKEDEVYSMRFNIELLSERLVIVTQKLSAHPEVASLPVGLFGASTGAASALRVAARLPRQIKAVVSRGGRPDLSMNSLNLVQAATLLIVGELDQEVIGLNRTAYDKLHCVKHFSIISNATHLFEEEGALEEVAIIAAQWFTQYLVKKNNYEERDINASSSR
jgi:pimeloyl-ACP methyl ester carboxylesterase